MFDSTQSTTDESSVGDTGHSAATRRAFVGAVGAASTGALAGCASVMGGNDTKTLRVTAWSGNYGERFERAIKPIFESRFDAELKVNFGWNEILAKIKSAPKDNPPFDVTVTAEPLYYNGRKADLFLPIRYEKNVPNIEKVIPYYKQVRPYKYGAPADGAPLTILYRKDLPKPADTWSDFTKPFVKNSSGVGVDSGFWIFPLLAAGVGANAASGAGELYRKQYHDELLNTIESWPITGWASSGTDIWQQFDNGIIDAAQWYFGQVYYDIDKHQNVSFSMPKANAGYMDNWCVVRGTDKRELGEKFINTLLDPKVQSKWSEEAPLFFTTREMQYADGLEKYLPNDAQEAKKMALPRWDDLAQYADTFAKKFNRMKTQ